MVIEIEAEVTSEKKRDLIGKESKEIFWNDANVCLKV